MGLSMSKESVISKDKRFCECGCGGVVISKWGHKSRYIFGHSSLGRFKKGHNRGPLHLWWKGGRSKHTAGYIVLSGYFDHPRNHNGRILEHIIVYEQYHKCCLLRWSNIHHINHDKTDNSPENLQGNDMRSTYSPPF